MKEETQHWVSMAQMDLASAEALLDPGLFPPAVFHCHLAVEKVLKALWVEQRQEGFPPRTHDLLALLEELNFDLPDWRIYLADLSRQAVASRYSSPDSYTRQEVIEYFEKARELCALLLQKLS